MSRVRWFWGKEVGKVKRCLFIVVGAMFLIFGAESRIFVEAETKLFRCWQSLPEFDTRLKEEIPLCDMSRLTPESPEQFASTPFPYSDIVPGGWKKLNSPGWEMNGLWLLNGVLYPALGDFVRYEWRFPNSLKELLHSDYLPVDSEALETPWGRKLLDFQPREMLSMEWWVLDAENPLESRLCESAFVRDLKTRDTVEVISCHSSRVKDYLVYAPGYEHWGVWGLKQDSIPLGTLVGRLVDRALDEAIWVFREVHARFPSSFEELAEVIPALRKLRNAFLGRNAQFAGVVRPPDNPYEPPFPISPGDFVMSRNKEGRPFFVVIGENNEWVGFHEIEKVMLVSPDVPLK